jgi:hypothetical protein
MMVEAADGLEKPRKFPSRQKKAARQAVSKTASYGFSTSKVHCEVQNQRKMRFRISK